MNTTKMTPAWARDTDAIVTRWESKHNSSALTVLRLGARRARRLRLFAAGCCRSPAVWTLLGKHGQEAVSAAERYVDDGGEALMMLDEIAHSLNSQIPSTKQARAKAVGHAISAAQTATVPPFLRRWRFSTVDLVEIAANFAAEAVGVLHDKYRRVNSAEAIERTRQGRCAPYGMLSTFRRGRGGGIRLLV